MRQRALVYRIRRRHTLLNHGLLWHRFRQRHPLGSGQRLPSQGLRRKDALWRNRLLVMMWRNLRSRRHTLLLLLLLRLMGHRVRTRGLLRRWPTRWCRCVCWLLRRGIESWRWTPLYSARHLPNVSVVIHTCIDGHRQDRRLELTRMLLVWGCEGVLLLLFTRGIAVRAAEGIAMRLVILL